MKKINDIKIEMNSAALNATPFLFAINYEMTEGFIIDNPMKQSDILWRVGRYNNIDSEKVKEFKTGGGFSCHAISLNEYTKKFEYIKKKLTNGDSFLANLTIKTPLTTDYSLEEIFYRSNSPYALLIPDRLVCFSPEIFVKIEDSEISSYPMKGTIKESENDAESKILNDSKEKAEHYTIVDFIRSDLSRVATDIKVDKLRYISHVETSKGKILQVSSQISGNILNKFKNKLGDIIFELLPAGSISGAPKQSTVEILEYIEDEPRGFYTGVFGYFDGKDLDSAVMIRYIEKQDGELFFRSGGGITINSKCDDEYNEILDKIYLPFV